MSRGIGHWVPCATAITLANALGLDSRRTKQLLFTLFVALEWLPYHSRASVLSWCWTAIQYALITLVIFQVARSLLATSSTAKWKGHGRVLLFPSKTTHSRFFPNKHSFVYSYLVVGIPVGWEGVSGGMVSLFSSEQPWFSRLRRGWFHIDPADYLHRGDRHLGLRGKLDAYLRTQVGAPDDDTRHLAESPLTCTSGCRPCGLSSCLPDHSCQILGIPFQPSFLLVSLLERHVTGCIGCRGQQYL